MQFGSLVSLSHTRLSGFFYCSVVASFPSTVRLVAASVEAALSELSCQRASGGTMSCQFGVAAVAHAGRRNRPIAMSWPEPRTVRVAACCSFSWRTVVVVEVEVELQKWCIRPLSSRNGTWGTNFSGASRQRPGAALFDNTC